MHGRARLIMWVISTTALFVSSLRTEASPPRYWHCPKPSYSPLHYWTPTLYSGASLLNPHPGYLYAQDRHPDVPKNVIRTPFPCPTALPVAVPYSFPFVNINPPLLPSQSATPSEAPQQNRDDSYRRQK
jgi:hypothetical protein